MSQDKGKTYGLSCDVAKKMQIKKPIQIQFDEKEPEEKKDQIKQSEKETPIEDTPEMLTPEDDLIPNEETEEKLKEIESTLYSEIKNKLEALNNNMDEEISNFHDFTKSKQNELNERVKKFIDKCIEDMKDPNTKVNYSPEEFKKAVENYINFQEFMQEVIKNSFNVFTEYLKNQHLELKDSNLVEGFLTKLNLNQQFKNYFETKLSEKEKFQELKKNPEIKPEIFIKIFGPKNCDNKMKNYMDSKRNSIKEFLFDQIDLTGLGNLFELVKNNEGGNCIIPNSSKYPEVTSVILSRSNLLTANFSYYFNKLSEVKIFSCPFVSKKMDDLFDYSKLTRLTVNNSNLTDYSFNILIDCLAKNGTNSTLKYLSVINNRITQFNLKKTFTSLEEINCENNKIYTFVPPTSDKLVSLNLSTNNFSFSKAFETIKECKYLVQMTNNLFILKGDYWKTYHDYLNAKLSKLESKIDYLTFEGLYNLRTKENLLRIDLKPIITENLISLNLSLCSLSNQDVISLLMSKRNFQSLKKLNISYNLITDQFFQAYLDRSINNNLKHLEEIIFSDNPKIVGENFYDKINDFIKGNDNLKVINFEGTGFDDIIASYIKNKNNQAKNNLEKPLLKTEKEIKDFEDVEGFINGLNEIEREFSLFFREIYKYANKPVCEKYKKVLFKHLEFAPTYENTIS